MHWYYLYYGTIYTGIYMDMLVFINSYLLYFRGVGFTSCKVHPHSYSYTRRKEDEFTGALRKKPSIPYDI